MFEAACRLYAPLLCAVGPACFTGTGCLLNRSYVATALHNLQTDLSVGPTVDDEDSPVVATGDGTLYECKIAIGAEERDFALLRLVSERRKAERASLPLEYPRRSTKAPTLGTALGFLTQWQEIGSNQYGLHFQSGYVSQVVRNVDGVPRLLLANTKVLPGMSGSPVFDSSGMMQGLVIESTAHGAIIMPLALIQFPSDFPNA